ncbi:MAG: glycosyltransferase family 2 protein [Anaerolineae bacterium]|nr:glycosyltransferase family 2 protein [Anaerolineae bacterium]
MSNPTSKLLTLVIPAFNEAQAIRDVLEDLTAACSAIVQEVIVVDDGSQDNTAELAESVAGVRVLRHRRNRGYGASLKTGINAATTEYVMTLDGDGQHRAEDVLRLFQNAEGSDMVIGQRTALLHSPLWRMPGKWLLTFMANYITRQNIPDLNSGMRLMRREVVRKYMHLCPSGFSFSTTITIALLSRGFAVTYVPITVNKRRGKSTVSLSTGLQTMILIIRIAALFDPLRIFLPISLVIALIGVLWGIPFALAGNGVSVGAMLAIVTSVLLFALGVICDQIAQLRLERYEVNS